MQDYIRKWDASFLRTVYLKPNKLYYDFLFVNVLRKKDNNIVTNKCEHKKFDIILSIKMIII